MTDVLKKDITTVTLVPAVAPVPPTPPSPAYCIDVVSTAEHYEIFKYVDGQGNLHTDLVLIATTPVITHTCFPGAAGSPGNPGHPAVTEVKYNQGWTGSAVSVGSLSGDGVYKFSVDASAAGVVTGFNDHDEGSGYVEIDCGIYCASGQFRIIEGGVEKTPARGFASTDVFAIRRLGTQVAYYQGTTKIYTSVGPSSGTVFADVSMYLGGDRLTDPSLSNSVDATLADLTSVGVFDPARPSGNTPPATPPNGLPQFSSINAALGRLRGFATDNTINTGGGVTSSPPSDPNDPGGGPDTNGGVDGNGDWPGRSGGVLRQLVGHAESYANGSVTTGGGTGSGGSGALPDGDFVGRSGNQLRGLVGQAFGSSEDAGAPNHGSYYAICAGVLNDPSSAADGSGGVTGVLEGGFLTPDFAVSDGILTSLAGFSIALAGMAGTVQGKLAQLSDFAANTTGAQVGSGAQGGSGAGDGSGATTGVGGGSGGANGTGDGDYAGRTGGELRGLVGFSYDSTAVARSYVLAQLTQRYNIFAFGHSPQLLDSNGDPAVRGVNATLTGGYSFAAFGGASSAKILSAPTLSAHAVTTTLAHASGVFPLPYLTASATTTGLAHAYLSLPRRHYSLAAYGGAVASGTLKSRYSLDASGTVARLAQVVAQGPRPSVLASATAGLVARASGTFPVLRTEPSGVMLGTIGRYELNAEAHVVVSVEYEAYAFAMINGADNQTHFAATHYTNFPFDRIVRFGSKHYGVAADGLYELTGDTFGGAPIVATVQTAEDDFNNPRLKRAVALYLGGRVGIDLDVSVISSELEDDEYTYAAEPREGALNHRVRFGQGIRARYLAFKVTNPGGDAFSIDDMTPEFADTTRTLV